MITLLHWKWRGGSPHIVMYDADGIVAMEIPISKERAMTLKAKGCTEGVD